MQHLVLISIWNNGSILCQCILMLIYIFSTQCDGFGDTQVSDWISVSDTPYQDSAAGLCRLLRREDCASLKLLCLSLMFLEGKKKNEKNCTRPTAGLVSAVCSQPKPGFHGVRDVDARENKERCCTRSDQRVQRCSLLLSPLISSHAPVQRN